MSSVDRRPPPTFAKPWKLEERGESFVVMDAAGVTLAFVYFEDDRTRRDFTKRLSKADARTMAEQIHQLPRLVRIARGIDPDG